MPGTGTEALLRRAIVPALALASAAIAGLLLVVPGAVARGRTAGLETRSGGDPPPAAEHGPDPAGRDAEHRGPYLEARTPAEARMVVRYARSAGGGSVAGLQEMARAADPLVAGNAVRALGRLGATPAEGTFEDLLRDARPRVRQEAVMALGSSGGEDAVPALERVLAEGEPDLRPLAIQALGRIGGPRARSALERCIEDPAASEVERAFAREALRDSKNAR
jgi:hypothetical protein